MEVNPVTLDGERARLVPMGPEHIGGLFEAAQDPRIWAFMPTQVHTREDMAAQVDGALKLRETGAEMPFVVVDKESGRIVGSTRLLEITQAHRGIEIGWTWLSPSVWRTRINSECKFLLLRYCFEEVGAIRVQLKTDARNMQSQNAIARIGGVREGVLRQHRILPDGYLRDSVYFSILDREWPDVKRKLKAILER